MRRGRWSSPAASRTRDDSRDALGFCRELGAPVVAEASSGIRSALGSLPAADRRRRGAARLRHAGVRLGHPHWRRAVVPRLARPRPVAVAARAVHLAEALAGPDARRPRAGAGGGAAAAGCTCGAVAWQRLRRSTLDPSGRCSHGTGESSAATERLLAAHPGERTGARAAAVRDDPRRARSSISATACRSGSGTSSRRSPTAGSRSARTAAPTASTARWRASSGGRSPTSRTGRSSATSPRSTTSPRCGRSATSTACAFAWS